MTVRRSEHGLVGPGYSAALIDIVWRKTAREYPWSIVCLHGTGTAAVAFDGAPHGQRLFCLPTTVSAEPDAYGGHSMDMFLFLQQEQQGVCVVQFRVREQTAGWSTVADIAGSKPRRWI